jgi:hypothetical protein
MLRNNRAPYINQQIGASGDNTDAVLGMFSHQRAGFLNCFRHENVKTRQDHVSSSFIR